MALSPLSVCWIVPAFYLEGVNNQFDNFAFTYHYQINKAMETIVDLNECLRDSPQFRFVT